MTDPDARARRSAPGGGVVGAVLAGGASSRMGRDKALVEVGGVPLAARAAAALRGAGVERVLAVGGDGAALAGLGLEPVPDRWPGEGPLGGVLTALDVAGSEAGGGGVGAVVLACDVAFVTSATVRALLAAPLGADAVLAAPAGGPRAGRPEPLVGLYRPGARAPLAASFEAGERAVHRALAGLAVATVAVDPAELANLNRPEDLPGGPTLPSWPSSSGSPPS